MNKWLLTLGLVGTAGQVMAAVDTTAPVVTASVAPGSYTSAQKFTLSIKDNSDSAPKLYFTRDGFTDDGLNPSAFTRRSAWWTRVVSEIFLSTRAIGR